MGFLKSLWQRFFSNTQPVPEDFPSEQQTSALLFVSPVGTVTKMTEPALLLLGERVHGQPLTAIMAEETQRQILQELTDRGFAPERFTIDEIVADSIANGIDRQNWLIGKGVHKAVTAEIVPMYDSAGIAGYQIKFN